MGKNNIKKIEFGELTSHTGYHIRRSYSTFIRMFALNGKHFNLKSQQSSILILTRENPGITPAAIADAIEIERSLMAKLLTDLMKREFIETRACNEDGRQKGLFITAKGKKFLREVLEYFSQHLEVELNRNLSERERQTLIKLLMKIYEKQ
jgi:DNA-binding MarR family transcriptional regulator